MKIVKASITVLAVALLSFGLSSTSFAFHSGGVAECEGCHTMHNSLEGVAMTDITPQYQTGPYLLQGNTPSEACLNCHEHAGDTGPSSYHISTALVDMPTGSAPIQRTPGGDFGWLKKDYVFAVRGTTTTVHGERKGHNIVAPAYGYNADGVQTVAPGGNYPAANLACSSCHDPHGTYRRDTAGNIYSPQFNGVGTIAGLPIKNSGSYNTSADPTSWGAVGVYRILGGIDYSPKSTPGFAFANSVPATVAPSAYNRTEALTQTRVAYGKGMSEWCANCHGEMLENGYTSGMAGFVHPAGDNAKLPAGTIGAYYNAYKKSGDLSGTVATAYSSLVPFEEGVADHTVASYAQLKANAVNDNTRLGGATGSSNVNCLSCHRAHASGYESMIRFPHANEFMTIVATGDASGTPIYPTVAQNAAVSQGMSPAEQQAALYDRPATQFAPYQRLLCNKCHAKD